MNRPLNKRRQVRRQVSICRLSTRSTPSVPRLVLRGQESSATAACRPSESSQDEQSAFEFACVGAGFSLPRASKGRAPVSSINLVGPCRHSARSTLSVPRMDLRGEESRANPQCPRPDSLPETFHNTNSQNETIGQHACKRDQHPHKHPFLIAWLIARKNHGPAAATTQKFNNIRFSNRSYIVNFQALQKTSAFCSNFRQMFAFTLSSAQMEGAVN